MVRVRVSGCTVQTRLSCTLSCAAMLSIVHSNRILAEHPVPSQFFAAFRLTGDSSRGFTGSVESLVRSPPASFFAATASSSARSFPVLCGPLVFWCPLTFLHLTSRWRCVASRSLSQRSLFATGSLRWLSHSFSRHFLYQPLLMQLTR